MEAESTFFPLSVSQSGVPFPPGPSQLDMASEGTSNERCKKSQCIFHLTVSQAWLPVFLPFTSHSCAFPLPPEHRDSSRAPSPLPTPPATYIAELFTPLHQLLSEVTRYFGPDDRGVDGSCHPTQMRSCM